jgi:hypothetical protein
MFDVENDQIIMRCYDEYRLMNDLLLASFVYCLNLNDFEFKERQFVYQARLRISFNVLHSINEENFDRNDMDLLP